MRRALRLPVYRRLLLAYGLNELASLVGMLALAVLVYRRTGSALGSTAFFLAAQVLPAFVVPAVVARLDRQPLRIVLPALYAVEAVVFGVLAVMASRFSLPWVLVLAFLDGMLAVVARAFARTAQVAQLTPADLLPEGNALTNAVFSVSFMVGPAIGGAIVVAGGAVAALLANCAIFAAVALVLVTGGLSGPASEHETSGGRLRAALAHVRGSEPLRILVYLQALGMVFFTISIPVEVVFASRTLHSGAGGYGALLSAWGAGAVAGSAVYARWRRKPARLLIAGSGGAVGCGLLVMAIAPSIAIAVIGAVLGGASNGVEMVASRTALQERTESGWMAMVMGLNESLAQAAPALGILLGGVVTALFDPRVALAASAVGAFGFTVAAWVALARPGFRPPPTRTAVSSADADATAVPSRGRETLVP